MGLWSQHEIKQSLWKLLTFCVCSLETPLRVGAWWSRGLCPRGCAMWPRPGTLVGGQRCGPWRGLGSQAPSLGPTAGVPLWGPLPWGNRRTKATESHKPAPARLCCHLGVG